MCISLTVDIGHCRHNLSEKNPGLFLWQTVLCYDVIKQLPTWTVLREEGKGGTQRSQINVRRWILLPYHILCVHVGLPRVPWRSGWTSLWPGRDDIHADDSSSSWPQSPLSHGAGHPGESHNKLFFVFFMYASNYYCLHVHLQNKFICFLPSLFSSFQQWIFNCSITIITYTDQLCSKWNKCYLRNNV